MGGIKWVLMHRIGVRFSMNALGEGSVGIKVISSQDTST